MRTFGLVVTGMVAGFVLVVAIGVIATAGWSYGIDQMQKHVLSERDFFVVEDYYHCHIHDRKDRR